MRPDDRVTAGATQITWEQAVLWLRAQPDMARVVRDSYLGEDVGAEARRFAASDEFQEVRRLLNLRKNGRRLAILDLGCGNGIASFAFAALGHTVVALDPDVSEAVGLGAAAVLARATGADGILPTRAWAESLPFADETFDIVYARQALHHLRDLDRGLRECARVLKPGGTMLATREHVADNGEQLRAFLDNHPLHRVYGGEHAFALQQYAGAARRAELDIRHVLGPYDSPVNHHPKTPADVLDEAVRNLSRRLGEPLARLALRMPGVLPRYLKRMSHFDRTPGRLYSFVLVKRGRTR